MASLKMPVQSRFFDGHKLVLNALDQCTNLHVNTSSFGALNQSWGGNLSAGESLVSLGENIVSGRGSIVFSAPGLGHEGSVIYQYFTPPWLMTENDNDGDYSDNPKASVTFGQYRGTDRMIYWREVRR